MPRAEYTPIYVTLFEPPKANQLLAKGLSGIEPEQLEEDCAGGDHAHGAFDEMSGSKLDGIARSV